MVWIVTTKANSHCDWEDVAGCGDGHARAKHHLLAVSVQHAVVRVPRQGEGEGDVYFFMGFPTYMGNITRCYKQTG